ncbi:DUF1648 domain-containing protein [Streptomyces sp. NPDC102340]|uniref:DUF1648 domain-containing protein n=1 Tax=unclassified Streptomyces TaxID=2593676 RepID=UPI00382331DB
MDHPDRTSRTQQPDPLRWYAGLPCLVAALVVAAVFIVSWPNLPDPMAVHFDEAGNVNRSSSPAELLLISEMTLLGLGLGVSRSAVRGSLALRTLYATSAAAAVSLGYLFTVLALVNADSSTADEARMPLWHLTVAAGLAAAAILGAHVLTRREHPDGTDRPAASGSVGRRRGSR